MNELQEILDWVYMQKKPESFSINLGIWDAGETPYTFYAVIANDAAHILASYGCETLEAAVQALYDEYIIYVRLESQP